MSALSTPVVRPPTDAQTRMLGALDYQAPFLIEKLRKELIIDSDAEGEMLFREVKRYLLLSRVDRDVCWQMYSMRVDSVWHQFVLFTHEYCAFCDEYLGGYVHHRPSNAPELSSQRPSHTSTLESFRVRYREMFGEDLPECWFDATSITLARRLINDSAGQMTVTEQEGRVSLVRDDGSVVLSVDSLARAALEFIATTGAFYVRELPGDLTDEERIGIAAVLVDQRLLRVAS